MLGLATQLIEELNSICYASESASNAVEKAYWNGRAVTAWRWAHSEGAIIPDELIKRIKRCAKYERTEQEVTNDSE